MEKFGIKGVVNFYDKDNKLIYTTNNTIVKTGRRALMDLFLLCFQEGYTSGINKKSFNLKFSYIAPDTNYGVNTEDLTIDMIQQSTAPTGLIFSVSPEFKKESEKILKYDDTIGLKLKMNADISSTDLSKFNQIYTTFNITDSGETLFSRAVLDPTYLSPGAATQLEYYFYF